MKSKTDLTQSQKECSEKVREFIKGDESMFLIEGSAGTGKTFLVGEIVKENLENFDKVLISAPTHNAVGVIKNKTNFKSNNIHHRTIHSLFSMKEKECEYKNKVKKGNKELSQKCGEDFLTFNKNLIFCETCLEKKIKEDKNFVLDFQYDLKNLSINWFLFDKTEKDIIEKRCLLIIDESSMINSEIFNLIKNYQNNLSKNQLKVIFIGDEKQLPPVNDTDKNEKEPPLLKSVVFEEVSLRYNLKEIVRQTEGSPIIDLSKKVKELSDGGIFKNGKCITEECGGFIYTDNDPIDIVDELYKKTSSVRYLTYRNSVKTHFCNKIRQRLYGEKWREIQENDTVNITGVPFTYKDNQFRMKPYTNEEFLVKDTKIKPVFIEFEFTDEEGGKFGSVFDSKFREINCYRENETENEIYFYDDNEFFLTYRVDNYNKNEFLKFKKSYKYYWGFENLELTKLKVILGDEESTLYKVDSETSKDLKREIKNSFFRFIKKVNSKVEYVNAQTIHKTQGRTIEYVLINFRDLISSNFLTKYKVKDFIKNPYELKKYCSETAQKLIYTAITRASKFVIIDTNDYNNTIKKVEDGKFVIFDKFTNYYNFE